MIWRGPMFNKALTQLFQDVSWGEVDYCIIDMPPGTGDAQISLCQMVQLAGAVVVTTPQEVALADVRKAVSMLQKMNVDVLGFVENMSGFQGPDGVLHEIFGSGGGDALSQKYGKPLLAQIPLDPAIRLGGDSATPISLDSRSLGAKIFQDLALSLIEILDSKQASQSAPSIVN